MAEQWPVSKIGSHVDMQFGFAFKSEGFREAPPGIRIARGDNVKEGEFQWDGGKSRYWPELTDELRPYLLEVDDVLIGMDGSKVGRNWTRVRKSDLPCLLVQRVARLRAKKSIDPIYVAALISSDLFKSHVHAVKTGSSIPHISGKQIADFEFRLPPVAEQRAIAGVLGALDDKIEANRKTARVLEGIARAVFTSWFVDFGPVRRRAASRPGSAAPLPADLAALFPTRLVDSPIGEVPEGWRVTNAGELAEFVLGGDWGKDAASEETPEPAFCIRGADIPSLQAGGRGAMPVRYLKQSSLEKRALRDGDLVVEISGGSPTQSTGRPVLVSTALLEQLDHPLVCSNFCRIFRTKRSMSTYTYLWLRWLYATDVLLQYENGTTGIKNFAFTIFCERHQVLIPPDSVLAAFAKIVDPMFAAIGHRGAQSATLAALRDALLPKLISGELRIADAEKIVGRAV